MSSAGSSPRGGGGYIPPPSSSGFGFKLDMRAVRNQLRAVLDDYKGWISRNPGRASDVESFFKVVAYLLPGRIRGNSTVIPELLYSTSSLISFWHDQLLKHELEQLAAAQQQVEEQQPRERRRQHNGSVPQEEAAHSSAHPLLNDFEGDTTSAVGAASRKKKIFRIQVALTILEYFQVFLEVAARRLWGDPGRWIVVFIMQAVKACLRSILVFYYKVGLTRSPPIPPFARLKYKPNQVGPAAAAPQNVVFVLKHSGRVIRKLNASPPMHSRDWTVPNVGLSYNAERNLPSSSLVAEMIHIARPLCHLMSMGACGTNSWKPWLLSLGMDLGSLYLHGDPCKQHHRSDQVELQKRMLSTLLYLMRSPFYDRVTKERLIGSLEGVGGRIPLLGNLLLLLSQAIPQWQATYSYVWT